MSTWVGKKGLKHSSSNSSESQDSRGRLGSRFQVLILALLLLLFLFVPPPFSVKDLLTSFRNWVPGMAEDQLKILHVSDIHCSYDNIQKLKDKLKQEKTKLDVVLISGDIANVPLDQYHTASKELLQEHHDILLRIVTEFVPVAEKVYFVPGNHDTLSHYDKSPLSAESSVAYPVNIHSHKLKIAPELYLLGLGGSVPGFREGKEHWEGFPYSSDAKFGEDLSALLDPVMEGEEETPGASYILMTHDGPNSSSTTLVQTPPEPNIIAGSDVLYEYLSKKKMQERTVLNIHGHVHPSIGMATIGSISVINPGALMEGNYGIYDLKRSSSGQQRAWKLNHVSLCRL